MNTRKTIRLSSAVVAAALLAAPTLNANAAEVTPSAPTSSTAQTPPTRTTDAIIDLPGAPSDSVEVPSSEVPASHFDGISDRPVANSELREASISTYATKHGSQSIIKVDSASASKTYDFSLKLKDVRISLTSQGGAALKSSTGELVGGVNKPWAFDANGKPVPTHFVSDGKSLTQVIDFNASTAFPVVADPNIWQTGLTIAAGTAVGAAVVAAIPAAGPTVGTIVGGCVTQGLNEAIDHGKDWYAVAMGCVKGSAAGFIGGAVGSVMKKAIIPWLKKIF